MSVLETLFDELDDLGARLLMALAAGLMLNTGFRLWLSLTPQSLIGAFAVGLLYGVATLTLNAVLSNWDMEVWGPRLGRVMVASLLLATLLSITLSGYLSRLGTDAMAFSAYSVDLVLSGQNPFAHSMEPATNVPAYPSEFTTPRIDGTIVHTLSYPAGAFLWFLPAEVLGLQLRVVPIVATAAVAGLIMWDAPSVYEPVGAAAVLAPSSLFNNAAGGVFDILWVLPLMLSLRWAYAERWAWAGGAYGLAIATKQQPWICGPFLLIFLWKTAGTWREFAALAGRAGAAGAGVFFLLNGPLILMDPAAWLTSVVTPISGGAPMVNLGMGMTLLSMNGIYPLATSWYTAAVVGVTVWLLAFYWLYWDDVKWIAWVVPPLILIVHYRSLASYFSAFVPIAVYGTFVIPDRLAGPRPTIALARSQVQTMTRAVAEVVR